MDIRNVNGAAIFLVLMFFLTAALGLTSLGRLGGSNLRGAGHHLESAQALYLTEAAVERARITLRDNFETTPVGDGAVYELGGGAYFYNIAADPLGDTTKRKITGYGFYPSVVSPESTRTVEVFVQMPVEVPPALWDNAIYSSGSLTANGNAYDVTGNVVAASGITYSADRISGTETVDPSASPLAALQYEALKTLAQAQVYDGHDNYYTADEIGAVAFPGDFYFQEPNPGDPSDTGVPHVVFIEGDLTLNGNWGTIGGFVLVVGDILTNPDAGADTNINGNGEIEGVVYALGEFHVNGGGGGINVSGGVIAADGIVMNGNTNITFSQTYMDAIENMDLPTGLTVLSWNEIESPI